LGAPHLKKDHEAVFACSMGDNAIHYSGHVKMMAAVQPFLSGAISKTVNMPEEVTVEEIEQLHMDSWKMGLKAVAIYRDNCKVGQPLSMLKKGGDANNETVKIVESVAAVEDVNDKILVRGVMRRKLPQVRTAKTFSAVIADTKIYITVGEFEDGMPGELFIKIAKQGSTLAGVMDALGISVSYGLQYGVPLKSYVHALTHMTFAPSGITNDAEIRTASSIVDYVMKRLAHTYLSFDDKLELGLANFDDMPTEQVSLLETEFTPAPVAEKAVAAAVTPSPAVSIEAKPEPKIDFKKPTGRDEAAPMCYNCGNQTQKAGTCYVCTSCGSTTGCS
jgi:ribonucleoside-diphosphate reductase alpha chain